MHKRSSIYYYILLFITWATPVLSLNVAKLDGDVTVSGLFEIRAAINDECNGAIDVSSVQTYEAVKWFIRKLNERNYIPGVTIGIEAFPTCRFVTLANERTYDFISRARSEKVDVTFQSPPLIGIIGPEYSSQAESTSLLISGLPQNNRILELGYSTTAEILSDHVTYNNFFRVVPSDALQIEVMISLMKLLEWNYIGIIYENDKYGVGAYNAMRKAVKTEKICIGSSFSVDVGDEGSVSLNDIQNNIRDKIITNTESKISGVLVFGYPGTVKAILTAADWLASKYADRISFIFSEAINLDDNTFKKDGSNVDILQSSKGSFVVTPPYLSSKSFQSHWRNIFTNMTAFYDEYSTNPWIGEVFKSVKACKPSNDSVNPNCSPMTDTEVETISKNVLYVEYALKAAGVMANILKVLHKRKCGSLSGVCENLRTVLYKSKSELINEAEIVDVKFSEEYFDELPSFVNVSIRFNGSDVVSSEMEPEYEVYHYRKCLSNEDSFCLEKVGQYQNSNMILNTTMLRNYHSSESGLKWPDLPTATCSTTTKCSSCVSKELADEIYFLNGDVFVIGLLPVYDKSTSDPLRCGRIRDALSLEIAEAMVFAVQTVNNRSDEYSNYFPNKKVGLILINSCNQQLLTESKILKLLDAGVTLDDGRILPIRDKILGFVAGYSSDISMIVSKLLTPLNIVSIGYASTAVALSDRQEYSLFLRVATPDDKQTVTLMEIVRAFNSSYIQIIYSDSSYGHGGVAGLRNVAKQYNICISNEIAVTEGKYSEIVDDLRLTSKARIVIVFAQSFILSHLFEEIDKKIDEGEFIFIGSEAMGTNLHQVNQRNKMIGSISLSLQVNHSQPLLSYLRRKQIQTDEKNPWIQEYYQSKNNCYFKKSFDKTFGAKCNEEAVLGVSDDLEQWTGFAMNAMFALLQGTNKALTQLCGETAPGVCDAYRKNPGTVRQKILLTTLDNNNNGRQERIFDDNGDGVTGYTINNLQLDVNTQTLKYVQVGFSSVLDDRFDFHVGDLVLSTGLKGKLPSLCPNERECRKCYPAENTTCPKKESCFTCFQSSMTSLQESDTSVSVIALGVVIGVLLCVVSGLTACYIISAKRKSKEDTYNKPNDLYLDPNYCTNKPHDQVYNDIHESDQHM